jgi:hypothetical protein
MSFRLEGICLESLIYKLSDEHIFKLNGLIQKELEKRVKNMAQEIDDDFKNQIQKEDITQTHVAIYSLGEPSITFQLYYGGLDQSMIITYLHAGTFFRCSHSTDLFKMDYIVHVEKLTNKLQECGISKNMSDKIESFITKTSSKLSVCASLINEINK